MFSHALQVSIVVTVKLEIIAPGVGEVVGPAHVKIDNIVDTQWLALRAVDPIRKWAAMCCS